LEGLEPYDYRITSVSHPSETNSTVGEIVTDDAYRGEYWSGSWQNGDGPIVTISFELVKYAPQPVLIPSNSATISQGPSILPTESPQGIEATDLIPPAGAIAEGVEQFGQGGENLKIGTNGKYYDNWGGNQYVKTSKVFDGKLMKSLGKNAPIVGTALDLLEVGEGFKQDGYRVGKNTIKQAAGVAGGMGGAWAGAMGGAAVGAGIGSVVPVIGTAIGGFVGGIIGGILGAWGGETAAEAVTEEIQETIDNSTTIGL